MLAERGPLRGLPYETGLSTGEPTSKHDAVNGAWARGLYPGSGRILLGLR